MRPSLISLLLNKIPTALTRKLRRLDALGYRDRGVGGVGKNMRKGRYLVFVVTFVISFEDFGRSEELHDWLPDSIERSSFTLFFFSFLY